MLPSDSKLLLMLLPSRARVLLEAERSDPAKSIRCSCEICIGPEGMIESSSFVAVATGVEDVDAASPLVSLRGLRVEVMV